MSDELVACFRISCCNGVVNRQGDRAAHALICQIDGVVRIWSVNTACAEIMDKEI